MPSQDFILLHWKKQLQVFLQNLETLKKQYNADTVHDLRVIVKKLRAYLKLLHLLYPQKDYGPDFDKTEKFFSILGKHRDIEVGMQLLESLEKDNSSEYTLFKDHLKNALQLTTEWMQVALADYDESELKELTIKLDQELTGTGSEEL